MTNPVRSYTHSSSIYANVIPEQFDDWLSRITRTPIASATADERRRVLDAQELSSLRHIRAAQVDQMARVNEARGLVISVMRSPLMRRIGEMQGFTLSPTPGTDDTSDVERPASVASDSTSDVQRPASILSDGMSMRSSGQSEDMSTDRDSSSSLDGYMSDYMSTSSSPPPSVTPQYPEPSASTSGWAGSSSVSVDVAAQANTVRIAGQKRARSPGSAHNPYILDE